MSGKQQMRWSPRGAHLMLKVRTTVMKATFERDHLVSDAGRNVRTAAQRDHPQVRDGLTARRSSKFLPSFSKDSPRLSAMPRKMRKVELKLPLIARLPGSSTGWQPMRTPPCRTSCSRRLMICSGKGACRGSLRTSGHRRYGSSFSSIDRTAGHGARHQRRLRGQMFR